MTLTPVTPDPPATPILTPILALLNSRAFILMVGTALVDAVIGAIPSLLPMRDELITIVTGLAALLIGKLALENAVQIHADGKVAAATVTAQSAPSALLAQGIAPLKPILSTEFSDTELRAIAYKLGHLPPDAVTHEDLLAAIRYATRPQEAPTA